MESLGDYLKTQRQLRNLSLEEVANFTRIKITFLSAIEEDRYDLLPSAVYAKGYLVAYAKYLGLDLNDIVPRYQDFVKTLSFPKPPDVQKIILRPPKKRISRVPFYILAFLLLVTYSILSNRPERPSPSSEQKVSKSIPVPSNSTSLSSQEETENQIAYQVTKKEISTLKEKETKGLVPLESSPFMVIEAALGGGIEKEGGFLTLTGKRLEFTSNNQRVFLLTRIKALREGKIVHVWLWKGKEFSRLEIEVKPPKWSVYSYITIRPQYAGDWMTEVRYGDSVLKTLNFKVTESDRPLNF